MKHAMHYIWSGLVLGTLAVSLALASEKKADPKMEEMMKKVQEAGTPGAAHKTLEPFVGDWQAEVKMFMDPSAPPSVSKGTAKATWAMGGRFVQQEFNGEFMGKPFHGLAFTGYDNIRKKYSSSWIDDMSTGMFMSEGQADKGGKVFTFEGTHSCPETGETHKAAKQIIRVINRDKHIYEMHDPSKGANSKTMEITYTRK
jgi:Protein of unknown function (DUF1579)